MRAPGLAALFIAAAMVAPAAAADMDFNILAGLDFAGDFDGGGFNYDASTGYSLGAELIFEFSFVEAGVGLEYGAPRGTDLGDVEVDYKHLYGIGRLDIIGPMYLAARVGYADVSADDILSGDVDGGETWSAGVGVELFDTFKVEAFLNNFSAEVDGIDSNFDYQTWSLRVAYTF